MGPREPLGALLERFLEPLGASWKPLGTLLETLGSLWERSGSLLGANKADLRGQKAPKREPRRVPNRGSKVIRAENSKTLIFDDSWKDFNDF